VMKLRENGFAVAGVESRGSRDQLELRYIVDPLGDFFRVTLLLRSGSGTTALARAYTRTRGGLAPAGAWARQLH
jgi:Conjugal transfer protein TrbH